jgi:glycerol-1-phosphate dehydrogenase [NAD(P)+]
MGEHLISHYVDMMAQPHPGTFHGEQVGVASLVMRRLQDRILALEAPPTLHPLPIDEAELRRHYGSLADACIAELAGKALDAAACDRLNGWLGHHWQELRAELSEVALPVARLTQALEAVGGPATGAGLGLGPGFWRGAIRHAREVRNRFSMLDVAAHAGLLAAFAEEER